MAGSTTELNLSTAVDSDDNADYLTINLANSLRTVDALFNNVTGHTHGGAHQGGPITPAAGSLPGTAITDGTITNAKLGPDVARDNLLVDGGFEIWQRGNGPFTTDLGYSADRWYPNKNGGTSTFSISRDTTNMDGSSGACAAVTYTQGTVATDFTQRIEDVANLRNRTLSFSVRVRSSVANAVSIGIFGASNVFSTFHTGDGTYQTLTVSAAVGNPGTLLVTIRFAASGTFYVDNACLVAGSQPANYVPMHPADDLARCLRYYEVISGNGMQFGIGQAAFTTGGYAPFFYKAVKPVTPTITASAPGNFVCTAAGGGGLTLTSLSGGGQGASTGQLLFSVASGLVVGNATYLQGSSAPASVAVEANP